MNDRTKNLKCRRCGCSAKSLTKPINWFEGMLPLAGGNWASMRSYLCRPCADDLSVWLETR